MTMLVKTLTVSMFATNCYLLVCPDTGEGVIIDPGADGKKIISTVHQSDMRVKFIINTHGHIDHIGANGRVKEAFKIPILLHENDLKLYHNPGFGLGLITGKQPQPDRFLVENERIDFGNLNLRVIETPGHTQGGISLICGEALFCGDTLFAGSIGRTDLAGGSYQQLLDSIKNRLLTLPLETKVYPGHGPATTIETEKAVNPFLR